MLYLTTHPEAAAAPETSWSEGDTEHQQWGGHGWLCTDSRGWLEGRDRQTSNPDGLWYALWTGPLSSRGWRWERRSERGSKTKGEGGRGESERGPGEFLKWIYLQHDQRNVERERREAKRKRNLMPFRLFSSRVEVYQEVKLQYTNLPLQMSRFFSSFFFFFHWVDTATTSISSYGLTSQTLNGTSCGKKKRQGKFLVMKGL